MGIPAQPRRIEARFEGYVQGVGFRYTTCRIAAQHAVTGYVQNRADGSVMVVAEGAGDEVERFMADLQASALSRYITKVEMGSSVATGEFSSFSVRYGR